MNLLLIRHAESVGNREYRIQGCVDYALSEQGVEQAHTLGQFLSEQTWKPTHIYTSPLQRAVHTTEILRDYWATRDKVAPITLWHELQEMRNGVLEGLTWAEAQVKHPDLYNTLMMSNDWTPIPGAETLKACRDRATKVVQDLLIHHQSEDRVWLVGHGGFLQYLIAALLGSDRVWGLSIAPTALFEFEIDCDRWNTMDQNRYNPILWKVKRFNEAEHLNGSLSIRSLPS